MTSLAESIDEDSMTLVSDMKTSTDTGAADGITIGALQGKRACNIPAARLSGHLKCAAQ